MWCSPAVSFPFAVPPDEPVDPRGCVDLWVHVDVDEHTVAVDLDAHGLAELVTGRTHWDGPLDVDLAERLDGSLAMVAPMIGRLRERVTGIAPGAEL